MEVLPDLPIGPLDDYRKHASFNWKSLKVHLEGEENVRLQAKLWNVINSHREFRKSKKGLSLDETRRKCVNQLNILIKNLPSDVLYWPVQCFQYDASIATLFSLREIVVPSALMSLGTVRHAEIFEKLKTREYIGAFSLTEIAHGTNIKGMETTATYDPKTENFILHTPNFKAAKCWAGMMGMTATHAIIYAQLITPDNINHGLHPFIVPIRNPKTLLPYKRLIVGDLGEKIGLNGVDNGFIIFNQYHIPRMNLLNRHADVTTDGKYIARIKNESKRLGASLGSLSSGRIGISLISAMYLTVSVIIAIRYCSVRKQFGSSSINEWPVIEYQVQQGRLLPHLASVYAFTIFSSWLLKISEDFTSQIIGDCDRDALNSLGMEIHALSSAAKPLCTWTSRDGIQDCREACGGHGYLKASRLGEMKAEIDATCTYEGENNVLIQQTSNWLLNQWENVLKGNEIVSPLNTVKFLEKADQILSLKFNCNNVEETMKIENLLIIYKWLICNYLKKTYERVENLQREGGCNFTTRNDSQMFFAKFLSIIYAEHVVIQRFVEKINDPIFNESEKVILSKLCSLYAAWSLEKKLGDIYAGGFANPDSQLEIFLREGIIMMNKTLVQEAVSLVDVLAPPDFILNSPLGMSDGEIYKHLEELLLQNPSNLKRVAWWKEIKKSKL
ncbi:peroxisomal acyl-coenzyme A oxidase 3-like [Leptopilina heterotoma]|uniref:peroxisomal acyl-coenzyme A oxidase 3-like n=1 Tax=Leptopilina heterotoma TaxID=63436 RepID=UPI001CA87C9B|nr:peroxisomal acyl-coenzyme A oxidase 3-like [Leptopilina heterotoma]